MLRDEKEAHSLLYYPFTSLSKWGMNMAKYRLEITNTNTNEEHSWYFYEFEPAKDHLDDISKTFDHVKEYTGKSSVKVEVLKEPAEINVADISAIAHMNVDMPKRSFHIDSFTDIQSYIHEKLGSPDV